MRTTVFFSPGRGSVSSRLIYTTFLVALVVMAITVPVQGISAAPGDVLLNSCSSSGVGGNANATWTSISANGRYVVFISVSTNLGPSTSGSDSQVFRKDLQTGQVRLCSSNSAGTQGNNFSGYPSIDSDGRYVTYSSLATNLGPAVTGSHSNVFRKDMQTGQVLFCSSNLAGTEGNNSSVYNSMSPEGRYVVFLSMASNLGPVTTPSRYNVFRKDMQTGHVLLCSSNSSGTEGNAGSLGGSGVPHINSDGRYVAFHSLASNLGPVTTPGRFNVFRKDTQTGQVLLCSSNSSGAEGDTDSEYASISSSGRYVAFMSQSTNLGPATTAGRWNILRKDLQTGQVSLCSSNSAGVQGNSDSDWMSMSADGNLIAFDSSSTNLGPATTAGRWNVFRKDMTEGQVVLCSSNSAGVQGNNGSFTASISAEGRYVAFDSMATNLGPSAHTGIVNSFRKELPVGETWFLAEGSTAWGFSDYMTIENPNSAQVKVDITYMPTQTANVVKTVTLPASSQTTINPADVLGQQDFSTRVQCQDPTKPIAVDRTMRWTGVGAPVPEEHSSIGVTSAAKTWYLPEGSSAWGFECWLLVQNPGSTEASVDFTYMIEGVGPRKVNHKVKAKSRATFNMETDIGQHDASVMLTSNQPVIPERAMYKNNRREGHESIGTTTPAADYYLAEGTTAWGFTTYVLVQNPQSTPTEVTVTYMTPSGPKAQPKFTMAANSRKTIRVNDIPGVSNTDLSTRVHGSKPIIAERAMYWNNGTGEACHDSIGMSSPHATFYMPDGQSTPEDGSTETWTLVQNPNSTDVKIELTYLRPSGTGNVTLTDTVPKNSRKTYNMADKVEGRAAIKVVCKTSGKNVMVERAMYWNGRGGGTDTIGGYSD